MNSTIWTTILSKAGHIESAYEYANREPNIARQEITKRYPGYDVLALVVGHHTLTYTFNTAPSPTQEFYEPSNNQPTGGSD